MEYILVQNRKIIHLGPFLWRQRYIQVEINDLIESGELTTYFSVPASEQGYINIGDGFEIIPAELDTPSFSQVYEHLAGPFWIYENNIAKGSYEIRELDINTVKGNLLQITANERYRKQTLGTTVTVGNSSFFMNTDSKTITDLHSLAIITGPNTINYKSPNGFIELNGSQIQSIVDQLNTYIQTQFNWENDVIDIIKNSTSIAELKLINITPNE